MKYLILLLLTFNAQAMFLKKSEINNCGATFYGSKKDCGENCIKQPKDHNCEYHKFGEHQVDDMEKPIYSKSETQACEGEEACQTLLQVKACTDPQESALINEDYTEVYCSKVSGYQQKTATGIYIDQDAKQAYEQEKSVSDSKKAAMAQIRKYRKCGQSVIDELIYRNNALKSLTTGQKAQILSTYSNIKSLLEVGNLVEAKSLIDAEPLDAPLITQEDKDALSAMIEDCL